jgi:GYF domain 2
MADRSWFFASRGQQQGPYAEAQLREFIARGTVGADTLVWSEGMTDWQRAGDIPGLVSAASGARTAPYSGGSPAGTGRAGGGPLSIDLGVWSLLGRSLLFVIGIGLVVPGPWVGTSFYRWIVSRLYVPGRPNLAFNGQVGDLWYVFVLMGLMTGAGLFRNYVQLFAIPVEAFLSWMLLRWLASNLSSNGQPLPIAFTGSAWVFIGWQILLYVSFITIIGWAWVATAWMRWNCRNVSGTRREIVFNATGLQVLWRTLVFALGFAFLIPIPWVLRWYVCWYVSQFALVDRTA